VICVWLAGGIGLFLFSLALHVIVWRIRRPQSYRGWLPILAVIFGPLAAALVWPLVPTTLDAAAILLLHGSLATVYIIGYTLVSATSPSVELLKLLDRTPAGLPVDALRLPFLAGALTGDRIDNLRGAGLVERRGDRLELGPRGASMTRVALLYRHAIGLPDGGGG
jgi:hypothetical protein